MSGAVIGGLYAITPDETDTAELLRKVHLALLGGMRMLQYRNKIADTKLQLEQAGALRELAHKFAVPLIVNDNVVLAKQVAADGVHLGVADGSVADARALLGNNKIIGVSCYNRLELAHAAVKQRANYVAFGAFFLSAIKPGAVKADVDLLQKARHELNVPIVAIGGITPANGGALIDAGADALAVISALWDAPDITGTTKKFSTIFKDK